MEKEGNQYVKGFNHAYLLAKYKKKLLKSILIEINQNDYFKGLQDGEIEFEKSKILSRVKELKKINVRKDRGIDLDLF